MRVLIVRQRIAKFKSAGLHPAMTQALTRTRLVDVAHSLKHAGACALRQTALPYDKSIVIKE